MSLGTIQIPVLFDMSGDSIVFGEDATGDFVSSHLDFALDMTTEANGVSLNAADISGAIRIGDQDTGDNIFYSGGEASNVAVDELCNRIAKAITRGKLVHLPKAGNHSDSGIPMGGRDYLVAPDGSATSSAGDIHQIKYLTSIASIGDEQMLGEAMARVASIHLVGSPLSAGIFQDKNSVQTDLETASSQTFGSTAFYNALAVQLSKVLGGSKSSSPMNNGSPPVVVPGPADLASNHYSEDFEDQAYTGQHTEATIIPGGFNGSNFCLKGRDADASLDGTTVNEWQTTASSIRGISFWFKPDFANQGSGDIANSAAAGILCVMRLASGATGQANFSHGTVELNWNNNPTSDNNSTSFSCPVGICSKLFIDGVVRRGVFRARPMQDNKWYHVYIEFSAIQDNLSVIFLQGGGGAIVHQPEKYNLWGTAASIDNVRFFNDSLTEAQIGDLIAGGNGNTTPARTIKGEGLMVDMGEKVVVSSYKVHPNPHASNIAAVYPPKTGKLLYSNDGYKYYLAHDFDAGTFASGYGSVGNYTSVDNNFGEVTARYFKFVTETVYTDQNTGNLAIAELEIIGTRASDAAGTAAYNVAVSSVVGMTHAYTATNRAHTGTTWHAEKAFDGVVSTDSYWMAGTQDYYYDGTTGLPRYRLLPAAQASSVTLHNYYGGGNITSHDLASVNSTLSGQTYTASSQYGGYGAAEAFDGIWNANQPTGDPPEPNRHAWLSNGGYTNGDYTGSETTDGYVGEWIQVDFGQEVILNEFEVYPRHNGDGSRGAKDMRLFSSADGTNWSQVYDVTGLTSSDWTWHTNKSAGPYTTTENTTGRYFRLVINKLAGNTRSRVDLGEIALRGLSQYEVSTEVEGATNYPLDASGTSVPALKSIYEQLMNIPGRSQIMDTRDIGDVVDNSNVTLTGGFPFIAGDKLVMYLRPKIVFATQTFAEQFNTVIGFPTVTGSSVPVYNIGRKSTAGGVLTGQIYTESSAEDEDSAANGFHRAFQGTKATDTSTDTERWWSHGFYNGVNMKYSATSPFQYTGTANLTTNVDGSTTLAGEWGQVDIGQNTVINKFEMWPQLYGGSFTGGNLQDTSPATFSLLGSLDGTNWTTIKAVVDDTDWGTTGSPVDIKSYDLGEFHGPYRYYRISIQNINGNMQNVIINQLLLHGVKHPSQVVEGGSNAQPTASAITDISGLITNFSSTAVNISDAFPGNATTGREAELNKWGWMGSANSDSLSLETTDIQDVNTIDLHIWKITVTL